MIEIILRLVFILLLLFGCNVTSETPIPPTASVLPAPTPFPTFTALPGLETCAPDLSDQECATLNSLEKVDDYPLYTMHYYGTYDAPAVGADADAPISTTPACSLFAAFGDSEDMLFGRNFDWQFSPALLLFTDPPDGYASVSMVDIAYLEFGGARADSVTDLSVAERRALLDAPSLPFDGMNEHGLVVGMAAVPGSEMPFDPGKQTVHSLRIIRETLDHARDVDDAIAVFGSYNIDWEGGPPLHYLIADASGRSALVEFYRGEMVIFPNESPWHLATNFLRAAAGEFPGGICWRYDTISDLLTSTNGRPGPEGALALLKDVAQENTQWSIVYGISSGEIQVFMGREYGDAHGFHVGRVNE